MEINLKITKDAFELAVPVAKEPKGNIFSRLEEKINANIEDIAFDRLGDVGIAECNGHDTHLVRIRCRLYPEHGSCI